MEDDEIRRLQQERRLKSGELQAFGAAGGDDDGGADRNDYVGSIDVGGGDVEDDQRTGLSSFTGEWQFTNSSASPSVAAGRACLPAGARSDHSGDREDGWLVECFCWSLTSLFFSLFDSTAIAAGSRAGRSA